MDVLNDMALFVEVVKARGFRRASEVLGIPNSTLSRRISLLEKSIGLRLLHRTTRQIELTEAGLIYFERCKRIVDEARLAHEQLGGLLEHPTGVLRASLPVDFADFYLAPFIKEFAEKYPAISFDFDLSPRKVDLVTEPFDVAIRMGHPPDSNLIARHLANLSRHIYASPRYLEKYGEPSHPMELAQHQCLLFRASKSDVWRLQNATESVEVHVSGRVQTNNIGFIRRLAKLDMGIAMLAEHIVADDLSIGGLHRILPEWKGLPIPVYAMTETKLLPAKTQRFIEFMREHLGSEPEV